MYSLSTLLKYGHVWWVYEVCTIYLWKSEKLGYRNNYAWIEFDFGQTTINIKLYSIQISSQAFGYQPQTWKFIFNRIIGDILVDDDSMHSIRVFAIAFLKNQIAF